ncbi:MAG: DUF4230 domain-containing protein [Opitutales bacterium]|tara:strand:+ start:97 stop:771 length:675 start_codon:yes stop_codon:yes gene_type:complete
MKPGRKKVSALWAFTLVIIVLILTLGYLGISALETAENIIRPERKVTIDSIIYSTIGELKKESKIVVMTGEVNLSVKRSHTKFFSRLNLGTTAVEVLVPKNKVQYVIPTDAISEESFRWNDETGEVSIEIPTPVIDEEIVEIQSDPSLIKVRKEIGWGRLESRSGEFLERQIRQDLRSLVIEEGKGNKLMLEQAKKNAQEVIRELFETFMRKENLEVPVQTLVN